MIDFRRIQVDLGAFVAPVLLIVVLNLCQYVFALDVTSRDGGTTDFGLPFSNYEYISILNRGRVLYLGIIGNLVVACSLGFIAVVVARMYTDNGKSTNMEVHHDV